jgi:hypothetical protein
MLMVMDLSVNVCILVQQFKAIRTHFRTRQRISTVYARLALGCDCLLLSCQQLSGLPVQPPAPT